MNYGLLFALCGLISSGSSAPVSQATPALHGDYVEARTCSVFAGACHYNSEYMTLGRDAILAFNITGGSFNGVSLTGVRAMAVVSADDNLADPAFAHHSEVLIDSSASPAQVIALTGALESKWGASLGHITAIKRGAVTFAYDSDHFAASAGGFGSLSVASMPNNDCCKQPGDVWYTPLMDLTNRKVGYTEDAAYTSGAIAPQWERTSENSAFYGSF